MVCRIGLFVVALEAMAAVAGAQETLVYSQPWKLPLASFESRVRSCDSLFPTPGWFAADDFQMTRFMRVTRVVWYGTVNDPKQLSPNRRYLVNFFPDGDCRPSLAPGVQGGKSDWSHCVTARYTRVGVDCRGKTVYRFVASLGRGALLPPNRLWFSVAEEDVSSANVGKVDFQWSGRKPVSFCPAVQGNNSGWFRTLTDPCYSGLDDLAFEFYGFSAPI